MHSSFRCTISCLMLRRSAIILHREYYRPNESIRYHCSPSPVSLIPSPLYLDSGLGMWFPSFPFALLLLFLLLLLLIIIMCYHTTQDSFLDTAFLDAVHYSKSVGATREGLVRIITAEKGLFYFFSPSCLSILLLLRDHLRTFSFQPQGYSHFLSSPSPSARGF